MAKSCPLRLTALVLCALLIAKHTSARDITLSLPQTSILAQIGEELRITCLASKCSNKNPGFTWANLMDVTVSGTVTTVEKTSTLTMLVDPELDGSYRCSVSCDNPPKEKGFRITVYSFPSHPILQTSTLVAGRQSRITCMLLNMYPSEILSAEILLDEESLAMFDIADYNLASYETHNISVTHDITLEHDMDGKEIKCAAVLAFPDDVILKKHSVQKLHLIYIPEEPNIFVYPSTTVRVGEDLRLTCNISDTTSQVGWAWWARDKETEMSSNEETLTILDARPEDSGVYICYATNSAGKTPSRVAINVQGQPEKPILSLQPGPTVAAGQVVTIECLADSSTNVTLWKMSEDGDLHFLDPEGIVVLEDVGPSDAAVYKCISENEYGASEASGSLTVEYPPRETLLSYSPIEVNKGDTVTLTCVSKGVPTPNFSIYQLLNSGRKVLLSEDPVITISNVTGGIYECQASNRLGSENDKLDVVVRVPPENTLLAIMPSLTVREGESVLIRCLSSSFPAPKMVLRVKTEQGVTDLEYEHGLYSIPHATVGHSGTYICESSNVLGQQTVEATLTVQVGPKNTNVTIFPSTLVREGDFVQISCFSEGSPEPRLVLKKRTEDEIITLESSDGSYTITHVRMEDAGAYICESTNLKGQEIAVDTLTVHTAPRNTNIAIISSPVVKEGDSVQIWCSSEGFPNPTFVLKRSTGDDTTILESTDGSYFINDVKTEDTGTYICEATNVEGQEVAEHTLTIEIPSRNTTVVVTPSQNITEGDTVTITCETHSIPSPTIILQKVCAENKTVLQTNNGTFTLHNVTRNDTGTYTLEIISSAGNETEVIQINVAERQQDPPSPRFNPTSIFIFGSVAFVSAGVIGSIIYHLKKSKLQGSYSLVKALRSKV